MKYIKQLSEINRVNASNYGGKAASLGELLAVGFPVPNGFAIAAEASNDFAARPLSAGFKAELHHAFLKLNTTRVAVRSSATVEDASDASWAGQLESYLNVSEGRLDDSVRKCWDSIRSGRALSYAEDKNLSEDQLTVGVVVQDMVDSQVSGVMFTANPVTSDRNSMIIEAVYGLGEMIVQGAITPDRWVVIKKPLSVPEFHISVKDSQMLFTGTENKVVQVPASMSDKATLREKQVEEIASIGLRIEQHFRVPQDIEWAFKEGKFYVVQSRPITTLK